jgi:hypothetical protein
MISGILYSARLMRPVRYVQAATAALGRIRRAQPVTANDRMTGMVAVCRNRPKMIKTIIGTI